MDILLWLDPNFGKKKINFFVLLDFFGQKKFYVLPQINFIYIYIYIYIEWNKNKNANLDSLCDIWQNLSDIFGRKGSFENNSKLKDPNENF